MEDCDFKAECYFLNVKTTALPLTTVHTRTKYCNGDFTYCTIYKAAKTHGIGKVPRYVSPDDNYELQNRIAEMSSWDNMGR